MEGHSLLEAAAQPPKKHIFRVVGVVLVSCLLLAVLLCATPRKIAPEPSTFDSLSETCSSTRVKPLPSDDQVDPQSISKAKKLIQVFSDIVTEFVTQSLRKAMQGKPTECLEVSVSVETKAAVDALCNSAVCDSMLDAKQFQLVSFDLLADMVWSGIILTAQDELRTLGSLSCISTQDQIAGVNAFASQALLTEIKTSLFRDSSTGSRFVVVPAKSNLVSQTSTVEGEKLEFGIDWGVEIGMEVAGEVINVIDENMIIVKKPDSFITNKRWTNFIGWVLVAVIGCLLVAVFFMILFKAFRTKDEPVHLQSV